MVACFRGVYANNPARSINESDTREIGVFFGWCDGEFSNLALFQGGRIIGYEISSHVTKIFQNPEVCPGILWGFVYFDMNLNGNRSADTIMPAPFHRIILGIKLGDLKMLVPFVR
jgi:hypothetical protein